MQAIATAELPSQVSHDKILVVFSGLVLVMLLAALDSTIVATALPTIVGELGGLAHLSWVVTAYLLAQTIVTPLYGKLGDLYGRKGVLQSAIVIFLVGSALCGISRNMTQLIAFRAVFGVSSIAGPLLGGFFTTHWTWRWIFYINLPLGVIALAVLAATLPARAPRVRHSIDYVGAALLAVALSSVILVTDLGGTEYPWSSSFIIGLIVIAAVSLVAFLFAEGR